MRAVGLEAGTAKGKLRFSVRRRWWLGLSLALIPPEETGELLGGGPGREPEAPECRIMHRVGYLPTL
jgi:hypothetical protein